MVLEQIIHLVKMKGEKNVYRERRKKNRKAKESHPQPSNPK